VMVFPDSFFPLGRMACTGARFIPRRMVREEL